MRIVNGYSFNDFCEKCGKVTENKIAMADSLVGICAACDSQRPLTDLKQVYYSNTDLWVTRFKVGNLDNVVEGKLLDSTRTSKG